MVSRVWFPGPVWAQHCGGPGGYSESEQRADGVSEYDFSFSGVNVAQLLPRMSILVMCTFKDARGVVGGGSMISIKTGLHQSRLHTYLFIYLEIQSINN